MKATAIVMSAKGHYAEFQVEGRNFKNLMTNLVEATIELPDEVEGVKVYDWTEMHIKVENTK